MVAAGVRNIKPGVEYNKFFSEPERKDMDWPEGSVYNTLDFMQKIVAETLYQTRAIANHLRGKNLNETCNNIWSFLFNHIQYKEDLKNVEQLRSPNRSWADRKTGIDCDCYSIFISSILTNLGVPHFLRITEYDHNGFFQHVFVVVPKHGNTLSGRQTYHVIDPVLDQYDYEKSFTKKHDKKMSIPHQYLNGVGSTQFGAEFERLNGLGNASSDDVNESIRQHLVNTLAIAKSNPKTVINTVDPQVFIKQLEYLLKNWNNPVAREAALEELAEMEDHGENAPKGTIAGLGCACRTGVAPTMPKAVALKKIALLDRRRAMKPNVVPITYARNNIANNDAIHTLCKGYVASPSMNGLNGKFFQKLKTVVQNTKTKVQNVGQKIKTAAKTIVQQNPVTVSIRGGVLLAMRTNAFKMADRIKWGYLTETEAVKRGFDLVEWKKVKAALDNTIAAFQKLGGKPENLKDAILKGRSGGLGVVAAAAATGLMAAAAPIIAKISGWLKNISNSKLFQKVKGGISKAKELIANKLPTTENDVARDFTTDATITDELVADVQNKSADVDTSTAFAEDQGAPANGEKTFMQKNGIWLLAGAAVLGVGAVAAFSGKKKSVGMIPTDAKIATI